MTDDLVVVRRFVDEMSAQLAAAMLDANGIPSQVSLDNAGGFLPSMGLVFPVRLIVRAEDADLAAELLDTPPDEEIPSE